MKQTIEGPVERSGIPHLAKNERDVGHPEIAYTTEDGGSFTMTLPLTIALLAVWSVAMFRFGRSVLFPPASLGIVWTITLFAI